MYYPQDICVNQPETQIFVADASSGFLAISNNGGAFTTFTTLGTLAVPGVATPLAVDYTDHLAYIASYDKGLQRSVL